MQVPDPGALVTGPVVIDSRAAAAGRAVRGAARRPALDGHDFAAAAVAAGAVAVLATRPVRRARADRAATSRPRWPPWPRPWSAACPDLTIAGITGSAGKTTTKDLTAQLVETLGPTVAPRGALQQRDRPPADRAAA